MSTIKTATLSNVAGDKSIAVDRVAQGTAAAWVNFNGTGTVAIRAAYNVSSITDNGTGNYTVNFSEPMPDANYSSVVTCGGTVVNNTYVIGANNRTTTSQDIWVTVRTDGGGGEDAVFAHVAIFR